MRLQAVEPRIFFGRPGSLFQLVWPRGGIRVTRERPTAAFHTGTGSHRVGRLVGGARQFELAWESLDVDSFDQLAAFDHGHEGAGPWALVDPTRVNLLTVNQSSATGDSGAVDDFSVATSNNSLVSDSTTYTYRGARALRWTFAETAPASTPRLLLSSPYTAWYGVPVLPSTSYVFSGQIRGAGGDPVVTITPRFTWYSAAGSSLSTNDGSGVASSSGAWADFSVAATSPSTVAYAAMELRATSATVTNGSQVLVDRLQLEVGSAATAWAPGTGSYPVSIISFGPEQAQWVEPTARRSPALTLMEVTN